MDKEKIEAIKQRLLKERERLLREMNQTLSGLHEYQGQEEMADFTDLSSMESDRNFHLRMKERDRNMLLKIERTLEKIEEGTFGICEECGREIGDKRLEARPVAPLCIDCKTEQEEREKLGS